MPVRSCRAAGRSNRFAEPPDGDPEETTGSEQSDVARA
jgi:hypothetical protein